MQNKISIPPRPIPRRDFSLGQPQTPTPPTTPTTTRAPTSPPPAFGRRDFSPVDGDVESVATAIANREHLSARRIQGQQQHVHHDHIYNNNNRGGSEDPNVAGPSQSWQQHHSANDVSSQPRHRHLDLDRPQPLHPTILAAYCCRHPATAPEPLNRSASASANAVAIGGEGGSVAVGSKDEKRKRRHSFSPLTGFAVRKKEDHHHSGGDSKKDKKGAAKKSAEQGTTTIKAVAIPILSWDQLDSMIPRKEDELNNNKITTTTSPQQYHQHLQQQQYHQHLQQQQQHYRRQRPATYLSTQHQTLSQQLTTLSIAIHRIVSSRWRTSQIWTMPFSKIQTNHNYRKP